jgi:hypothetical protein
MSEHFSLLVILLQPVPYTVEKPAFEIKFAPEVVYRPAFTVKEVHYPVKKPAFNVEIKTEVSPLHLLVSSHV